LSLYFKNPIFFAPPRFETACNERKLGIL